MKLIYSLAHDFKNRYVPQSTLRRPLLINSSIRSIYYLDRHTGGRTLRYSPSIISPNTEKIHITLKHFNARQTISSETSSVIEDTSNSSPVYLNAQRLLSIFFVVVV
jgi:hypothetical protein